MTSAIDKLNKELTISPKYVFYNVYFKTITGSTLAALLLSFYWSDAYVTRATNEVGFFCIPDDHVEKFTGLSMSEQEIARAKLIELGILEASTIDGKTHYRVDDCAVYEVHNDEVHNE